MKIAFIVIAIVLLSGCTAQVVKPYEAPLIEQLVTSGCAIKKLQLNHKKQMMTVDCAEAKPEEEYLK